MRTKELAKFVVERYRIHERKEAGKPWPWTKDPILQQYRFCNMFREKDTETRWIADNWRCRTDRDLWFAMVVARLVNWHETLAEIGYPVPWRPKHFLRVMDARPNGKVFGSGYVIPALEKGVTKAEGLVNRLFNPLWRDRKRLRDIVHGTLAQAHKRLTAYDGLGSFLAGQVIADLKYCGPLANASDWWTWAASGPGSRRGLNRVLGRPTDMSWSESEWLEYVQDLRSELKPLLRKAGLPPMHAQDIQSGCCEYDKYERARLGEGRPKRKYVPAVLPEGWSGHGRK